MMMCEPVITERSSNVSPRGKVLTSNLEAKDVAVATEGKDEPAFIKQSSAVSSLSIVFDDTCSFHCNRCNRDIVYTARTAAAGAFASHVKWCGNNKKRRKLGTVWEPVVDSFDEENAGSFYEANGIDHDKLRVGSRVLVLCPRGRGWQATIKKTLLGGFLIHYDGTKETIYHWVPISSIVDLLHEGNECQDVHQAKQPNLLPTKEKPKERGASDEASVAAMEDRR